MYTTRLLPADRCEAIAIHIVFIVPATASVYNNMFDRVFGNFRTGGDAGFLNDSDGETNFTTL